jgi:diguanylate cyclase (GGDEF)-like protein/PAS domain S-box-containing protein
MDGRAVFIAIIQDITERQRAEEELRASLAQRKLILDNVPAMICYLDSQCRVQYANRQYAEFHASKPDALEGRMLQDIIGADDWAEAQPRLARAFGGETVTARIRRRRQTDGSLRELDLSLVPNRDEQGRVVGVYAMLHDVTRRRRAEESLRLLERALESSANSVMITRPTDHGQEIVYVNPAFERITGYSREEVIGRNPRLLHREDRDQPGIEALRMAVREGRETSALIRDYRKDGTLFWNEVRVAPVRDEAGRVTHFIGISSDVSERIRYQEEIERNANYDSLTGLPNRNLLKDRLTQAVLKAERSQQPMAVMYLDVDHLKRINDSFGHLVGDRVIAAIGSRLAGAVRSGDTVARVGGDEFVIVLADLKREEDAAHVASKVLNFVSTPLKVDTHEFVLSASAGLALYPKDGRDAATLLQHADTALYRAKEDGRDCFRFFAAEMNARVVRFVHLEEALRRALQENEFGLQYQPIVRLRSGAMVGAEALIRWQRADGSAISPGEFIPVAEGSGLIVPLGRWVLATATQQVAAWNRRRREPLFVSVNISARQFRDPRLVEVVRETLAAARLDPAMLKLEITETAMMQDVEAGMRCVAALKALGIRLAIDDFGTGYSSLAYLKRFPIDALKIDRSFVRGLPDDEDSAAICGAVIDMAHRLGIEVVAEGVETPEQMQHLARWGCDMAQGYLFGRPLGAEDFAGAVLGDGGQ